ncbi:HdeD family acid-resistance protein [Capillimicrobium parvum]|uniref:HdeD family acid-resistance protein n=1 Tax=Capillimicrobium parvum TaxID=2884022 RepID=A0A9E6XZV0_9ACTN|nr:DUF308 domain-containing protein [Capillimicrobium parvum]UGS37360.1 hypothetical protein DSM104329_03775 [Capillimicrobium parvum]
MTTTTPAGALHEITRLWWLVLLFGIAVLAVGVFFVASPHETLSTFTVIAGIFLLVDGVLALIASVVGSGEGRGLVALIGVLSVLAGLVLVKRPFDTLVVFALIVGAWFVVAGIARLIAGFAERDGRGGNLLIAAIDVVAGIVILAWPDLGLSTFAVILGIVLIIRGLLFVFAGWQLRGVDRDLDRRTA